MGLPIKKEIKKYNYRDYLSWTDDNRWEIIDGSAYMQAAPVWQHQEIVSSLISIFRNYFKNKECTAFVAPFDVRISTHEETDEEVETVLQPDIVVVCDKSKLKGTGYFGIPTFVVEILSPSTAFYDKNVKFKKYEESGINEYWIIDPINTIVERFSLNNKNEYGKPDIYSEENQIKSIVFPNLEVDLKEVFASIK
ncbi:MAG TPA: Uma2 family endonuclease [Clostridiales bacterium]|nr:Uma2 family endonuclease [Clostridiales bacterium]